VLRSRRSINIPARISTARLQQVIHPDQEKVLKGLESGEAKLEGGVDAKSFFAMLLQNTKEGYFLRSHLWRQQGYGCLEDDRIPGAHYNYKEWVVASWRTCSVSTVGFKGRPGWKGAAK